MNLLSRNDFNISSEYSDIRITWGNFELGLKFKESEKKLYPTISSKHTFIAYYVRKKFMLQDVYSIYLEDISNALIWIDNAKSFLAE